MRVLVPKGIASGMIAAGTTIAEPAAGETAWVTGGSYSVDDRCIRGVTHREYVCVQAHSGRSVPPEDDAEYWLDRGPTQQFAPFDHYVNTAARAIGSLTYVLSPGFFNAVALYGLTGGTYLVRVKDAPGGVVLMEKSGALLDPPTGWYQYLFGRRRQLQKVVVADIPLSPTAELTVTVAGGETDHVGLGMLIIGDLRPLVDKGDFGGVQVGARAEPVSYSYIDRRPDGTVSIRRRHSGTNLDVTVLMPRKSLDAAVQTIQELMDVPVSWISTSRPGFDSLNVFGIGSATVSFDSALHGTIHVNVKGMI